MDAKATVCRSKSCSDVPSCGWSFRRPRRFIGASCTVAFALASLGRGAAFEFGESIEALVSAGESITLTFEGDTVDAVAVSYQQCSGSSYMSVEVTYDGDSLRGSGSLDSSLCHRIVGSDASLSDTALDYDNLCSFRNSGTVGIGYEEESTTLEPEGNSTDPVEVNPELVTVVLSNDDSRTATAQIVMFSSTDPATTDGAAIDRVQTSEDQDENTFTIVADFQGSASSDETFCPSDTGCAVYAYYLDMDELEDEVFGTTCQAEDGVKVFEGNTEGDLVDDTTTDTEEEEDEEEDTTTDTEEDTTTEEEDTTTTDEEEDTATEVAVVQAITAFEIEACVELPKLTAGNYRVYIIVSPDTYTDARVGYGLQDQLIYASSVITVEDTADAYCPEEVTTDDTYDTDATGRTVVTPIQATGVTAMALATAAARAGLQ